MLADIKKKITKLNKKGIKTADIIFLFFVFSFFLAIPITVIRPAKVYSVLENRNLNNFQPFNIKDFIKGEYQTKMEDAISDQLIASQTIKTKVLIHKNKTSIILKNIFFNSKECDNKYQKVANNFYIFNCSDYLLYGKNINYPLINETIDSYLNISIEKKYFYFIEKDSSLDFSQTINHNDYEEIKKRLGFIESDYLKINTYDDYEKFMYKNDHHLNHEGTQKAYEDIIKMLKGENEETLQPIDEIKFDVYFHGSKSRVSSIYNFNEKFTVYEYNLPNMETYINGKKQEYGNEGEYFNGNYSAELGINHYAKFYGNDYGEVIFKNLEEKSGNLLIIAASYSNSMNKLIASHFKETYVVDLRYYKDFDFNQYVKENNIDQFLFIADNTTLQNLDFKLGGE